MGLEMDYLIEIRRIMRGERDKTMERLTRLYRAVVKKIRILLDVKARRRLKLLKYKLDFLEKSPRVVQRLEEEVGAALSSYPSKSLQRKWIAYKYRLGLIAKSYPEPRLLKALENEAKSWKEAQEHVKSERLTASERDQLNTIAEYVEFSRYIIQVPKGLKALFDWTLRDGNDPAVFIEFPFTVDRLIQSNLSQRIGRLGGLSIRQGLFKFLTLPFEGREYSIMNDRIRIEFSGGLTLALGEIFKIFEDKAYEGGVLEYMENGIVNFSPLKLDQTVPLDAPGWWEALPVLETLTEEQVIERYGVTPQEGQWVASAAATRGSLNLDFNNTHAFLEIAIPQENGAFRIYDFGKVATRFPKTIFDMMAMFCRNVHATLSYPDENVFYTFREKAYHSFLLSSREGALLMHEIKTDIEKARAGNMVYQIETENCAEWVHSKLSAVIGVYNMPRLFYMPLLETEPNGLVKAAFRMIKRLPERIRVPVLAFLHLPLGAFQETLVVEEGKVVVKSVKNHGFFEHGHIYLPALLNHTKEQMVEALKLAWERALWKGRLFLFGLESENGLRAAKCASKVCGNDRNIIFLNAKGDKQDSGKDAKRLLCHILL